MGELVSTDTGHDGGGPTVFGVDPRRPSRRVWRQAPWPSLVSGATALLTGLTTLVIGGGAGYLAYTVQATTDYIAVAIMALASFGAALLTAFAIRDWWSKRRCHIALEHDDLVLNLPRGRSPTHRPPAVTERVAFTNVSSIDSRLENFGTVAQRAYRLKKRDGSMIYLFEDRGLGTPVEGKSLMPVAHEIAEAAGLHLTELPEAEGKTGRLPWSSAAPPWPDVQESRARIGLVVKIAGAVLLLVTFGLIFWAAWFVAGGLAGFFT